MIALHVRVAREHAEAVLADLADLAPGGFEERDAGDAVEYVLYGAEGELPALPDLEAAAGAALVGVRTEEIADDWAESRDGFAGLRDTVAAIDPAAPDAEQQAIDIISAGETTVGPAFQRVNEWIDENCP